MNGINDDDIAAWYGAQELSRAAVERLSQGSAAPPLRPWQLFGPALAVAAAFVVGVGITVWAQRTMAPLPLEVVPLAFADPPLERSEPSVTVRTHLTPVAVQGGALQGFLDRGNFVDVLVTGVAATGQSTTTTVQQAAIVWAVEPDEVTLLTTPEQARDLRDVQARGMVTLSLRNDLDVGSALAGVPVAPLRRGGRSVAPRSDVRPTATDPRSTFAMDVDTASYARARGLVASGRLPDPAEVRVEEFVNAFPYDYARPDDGVFAAHFEAVPSPWTRDFHVLRVGLRARDVPADQRGALHLTFLVDTSGSMLWHLPAVKRTLSGLVEVLEPRDTVALVRFDADAQVLLQPTSAAEPQVILGAVERLQAGGQTDLQAGLVGAYELAAEASGVPGDHRVVLCTDGMPNLGATTPEALSVLVRPQADLGVGLTALGFGRVGYRDDLMEAFADASDGNYAYIDSLEEARTVLVDRLMETLLVVARDAKAQIRWNPRRVQGWRLIGYDDRRLDDTEFRDDAVDAGEIGPGHRVTALYEVRLVPESDPSGALGTLFLRAEPPGAEGQAAIEQRFDIAPRVRPVEETSSDTRLALAAASVALRLADHPLHQLGWTRTVSDARAAVRAEYPADEDLVTLAQEAGRMGQRQSRHPGCREFVVIQGGERTRVWVDETGMPCE